MFWAPGARLVLITGQYIIHIYIIQYVTQYVKSRDTLNFVKKRKVEESTRLLQTCCMHLRLIAAHLPLAHCL